MHDILKHRRGDWPRAAIDVLASVSGFGSVIVRSASQDSAAGIRWEEILRAELSASAVKKGTVPLVRGLLGYSVDALPQAHAIFQEEHGFLGSYCHGMMHRREGDFWNANYWFRSAGKPPAGLFARGFEPERLTSACESAARGGDEPQVLEALALEAAQILDHVFGG